MYYTGSNASFKVPLASRGSNAYRQILTTVPAASGLLQTPIGYHQHTDHR